MTEESKRFCDCDQGRQPCTCKPSVEATDSARLPVVAWQVEFPLGNGAKVYEQRPSWAYESYGDLAYVTHELCRLTDAQSLATDLRLELNAKRLKLCAALKERNDAQARLAEKDARIAQLAAHARGKNKALANALKEIERLKRTIETGLDNELALVGERTELRAQLAQIQAAPAERGVVVPYDLLVRALEPVTSEQYINSKHELLALMREFARLNPAPATADSDVREVK